MHKWVMSSLMWASAPARAILAVCVGHSASCELPRLLFGIRNRAPLCIVFLLILDWDCQSLCFYNSLGNTPMCPWMMLVQSNTTLLALSFQFLPYSLLQNEASLLVSLLPVLHPSDWAWFLFFPTLLSDTFPCTAWLCYDAPLFSLPTIEGSMTRSSLLGWIHLIFWSPRTELELSHSFVYSLFLSHCGGQDSVYSCGPPPHTFWLVSLSLLGCYKAATMGFYGFTIEANALIKWKVSLFLKILNSN